MEESNENDYLLESLKNKISMMISSVRQVSGNEKSFLLVLDVFTTKMISSLFKLSEILTMGITAIEKLEVRRKRFPNSSAIYLIEPNFNTISHLLNDLGKNDSTYAIAHIFFTRLLSEQFMDMLSDNAELLARVKTLKEIHLPFICKNSYVLSSEQDNILMKLYSKHNSSEKDRFEAIEGISNRLSSLANNFMKFYEFEILYNTSDNSIPKNIALMLKDQLEAKLQKYEDLDNDMADKESGKITYIILDRSLDMISPFLSDFKYESLIYDLIDVKNDMLEDKEGKKNMMSKDKFFQKYKYSMLSEVSEQFPNEVNLVASKNTSAKFQKGDTANLDLSQISSIMKSMPSYTEMVKNLNLHNDLMEKIWSLLEQKDYKSSFELEQSLCTGLDKELKPVPDSKLFLQVGAKLGSDKIEEIEKLRLSLLACITLKLPKAEKTHLLKLLNEESQKTIANLKFFGIEDVDCKKIALKEDLIDEYLKNGVKSNFSTTNPHAYLDRYLPTSRLIVENLISKFNKKEKGPAKFGRIKLESIAINEKKPTKQVGKGKSMDYEDDIISKRDKIIVYTIGAMSYKEVAFLRNIQSKLNPLLIVASDKFLSQKDFIQNLSEMN